jgi:DNA-directed RNA polymerase specialized sigma24 family protein
MEPSSGDVTGALVAIREGDDQAFDRLVQWVYQDLRRIARSQRRRRPGGAAPLQTTALVHETYLRLVDQTEAGNELGTEVGRYVIDHALRPVANPSS